jgi:hypothetical protein
MPRIDDDTFRFMLIAAASVTVSNAIATAMEKFMLLMWALLLLL